MFQCILGERDSGKSVFVEKHVEIKDKNALYIATLPELRVYREMIERHKQRRPLTWDCIELFKMPTEKITSYPYYNYHNIILDNLSYFLLFQFYSNRKKFIQKCDKKIFSLINKIASDNEIMVYLIDTPFQANVLEGQGGKQIRRIFTEILNNAVSIQRFCGEKAVYSISTEEGKNYLFCTGGELCQEHLQQNN